VKWLALFCVLLFALAWTSGASAQGAPLVVERQLKAAYLYKFTSYIDWPEAALAPADRPILIGVMGADDLAAELEQFVAGRTAKGRPVAVRKLRRGDSLAGLHMLFIGRAESGRLNEILAAVRDQPVLTITDSEEAYAHGSMINFVVVDDKLRFEVSLKPAALAGLRISALMLASAYKVSKAAS
jgi:hypothetical protein